MGRPAMFRRTWGVAILTIGLAAVLLLTTFSLLATTAAAPSGASSLTPLTATGSATVKVGSFSAATSTPGAFWGVNVAASHRFDSADAKAVAATPVNYIVFPSGVLAEEFNYTSGVITSPNGAHSHALTTTAQFVASCKQISCRAILQLPAEIDKPGIAAYYANYVVHKLGYQPAYWEIGNAPSGWTHFDVPWSEWKTKGGGNITPLPFANLVHAYITAVLKVDPSAQFLALGVGMSIKDYAKAWVTELAKVDGTKLAGISVHSYVEGGPSHPTDADLLANLNGVYSLPDQITADRSYIKAACSSCSIGVFVTEINAAEVGSYENLLEGYVGTLYLAAETTQALALHVANLDWFAYDSHYQGSWSRHPMHWQMQYYLFSDVLTQLKSSVLPTAISGPSTLYGIATYDKSGLALLLVNVAASSPVSVNIASAGFVLGRAGAVEYSWADGAKLPSKSSLSLSDTVKVPAMSIVLLTVPAAGMKSPLPTGNEATALVVSSSDPATHLVPGLDAFVQLRGD
jgi:hypothetical protein